MQWAVSLSLFVATGKSFLEAYQSSSVSTPIMLTLGIDAILSTVLADATLVWDLILVFA